MLKIAIENIIYNIILFCICGLFMHDVDSDIARENWLSDTFICWLLCTAIIYGTLGIILFIVMHDGHLQPLL